MTTVDGRISQCMVSLFMLIVSAAKWLRVDGNPARLSDYLTSSHGVALTTLLDNPFANELIASVIIFSGYQLLTLYDVWKRRSSAQHTTACIICTYMLVVTLPLFQIKDVRTQLLLRYISWFFTFSSVLQTHYVVASPRHISSIQSQPAFLILWCCNLMYFMFPSYSALVVLWLVSGVCMVVLVWVPERETLMLYMILYGGLFTLRELGFFSEENLVRAFIIADIVSKCINMNDIRARNIPLVQSTLNSIKLLRIMSPKLEEARQAGLVTDQELANISQLLDKRDNGTKELSEAMMAELVDLQNESLLSGSRFSSGERYVMFLDVVDYTAFVMNSELAEVVVFMNALYIEMDLLAAKHKVGKLETVGDSYVVVTSARDTVGLLNFGTDVLTKYGSRLRVGIDFGVVADVVLGHDKLRQSCIGHAVNCASRMQSTGKPGMMHVSTRVRDVASRPVAEADLGSFVPREGLVLIKGVGEEQTFFFVPAPTPQM